MKFNRALVISILATSFGASCAMAAAQTFTRRRPATRTVRAAEKRQVKETKESREPRELDETEEAAAQPVERTIATDANVAVRVCVASGSITGHGWDRKEVRARS